MPKGREWRNPAQDITGDVTKRSSQKGEDHRGGDWGADRTRQRAGEDTNGGTGKQV